MTKERHMVTIETERTGKITITPCQFDMLLAAALEGLNEFPEENKEADALWKIVWQAKKAHSK